MESIKHWGDNEKYALLLRVEVIQSVVVLRLLGQRVARFAEKTDLLAMLAPDNLTLHCVKVSDAWRAALDAQCTVGRTHCSESIFGHRKSNTASKSVKLLHPESRDLPDMRDLIDLRAITGVYQAPFWISLEDLASRWTTLVD